MMVALAVVMVVVVEAIVHVDMSARGYVVSVLFSSFAV